jgi:hypothetical protein
MIIERRGLELVISVKRRTCGLDIEPGVEHGRRSAVATPSKCGELISKPQLTRGSINADSGTTKNTRNCKTFCANEFTV